MASSIPGGASGSGAMGGIGEIIGGVGSFSEGKQLEKMGRYNATIYEQQAQSERTNQVLLETQKKRILKSQLGTQTAIKGKSGLKMGGSALEVALDSMTNANLDMAIDKYNSDVKVNAFNSQAAMSRWEGKQQKKAAYLKGGLSILSGAVKIGTSVATGGVA